MASSRRRSTARRSKSIRPAWHLRPPSQLRGLLGKILNANELKLFVDQYLKTARIPPPSGRQIAADPAFAARAAELKFTVQLGGLTNNHAPLVAAIRALPDIQQPSDLVRLDKGKWKSLIRTRGVGVPADTPGANARKRRRTTTCSRFSARSRRPFRRRSLPSGWAPRRWRRFSKASLPTTLSGPIRPSSSRIIRRPP